ncbi:unnamed protein product [Brassica rapa subsp. trilocularis]
MWVCNSSIDSGVAALRRLISGLSGELKVFCMMVSVWYDSFLRRSTFLGHRLEFLCYGLWFASSS